MKCLWMRDRQGCLLSEAAFFMYSQSEMDCEKFHVFFTEHRAAEAQGFYFLNVRRHPMNCR